MGASGIRITLTIFGMFLGAALIGISIHDKVDQAWAVLTGNPIPKG